MLTQVLPAVWRQVGHQAELEGEDRPDQPEDPLEQIADGWRQFDELRDGDDEQEDDREQNHRQAQGPLDAVGDLSSLLKRAVVGHGRSQRRSK